ncbi:MAG: type I-C CRISPR-associated protein Cas8c/Csd1 [Phocaeicola sp.]
MDKKNRNIGYVLGRLCAVTKAAHEYTNNMYGNVKMDLAAEQPISWKTQFTALKNIKNRDLDSVLCEIVALMDASIGIPDRLNVEDQSRFHIGFYHQLSYMEKSGKLQKVETITEAHTPIKLSVNSDFDNSEQELKR